MSSMAYVDVPVAWLPQIGKIFAVNISDFSFVHQISRPLTRPMLNRISRTYGVLCSLGMCSRYHVVYNSMIPIDDKKRMVDEAMMTGILPSSNVHMISFENLSSTFDKYLYQGTGRSGRYADTYSDLTLSFWYRMNHYKLLSNYYWVMQDDVGWVGEFGQALSMIQISTQVDYLAPGCQDDCIQKRNASSSLPCSCITSFVRYSHRLLESKYYGYIIGKQRTSSLSHIAMQLQKNKNRPRSNDDFRFVDLLDIISESQIMDPRLWGKSRRGSKNIAVEDKNCTSYNSTFSLDSVNVSMEMVHKLESEYDSIDHPHMSNVFNFSRPAKPICLIFRNIIDS